MALNGPRRPAPLTRISVTPRHTGRKRHMGDLPVPSPAQARKIWGSMARPSTRRVATKLRQAGIPISHQTINRWRRNQWRPLEREQHPLETARARLDDGVPLLTGDPMTTANSLVEQTTEREKLEQLTDRELLRRAAREVAIAVCLGRPCDAAPSGPGAGKASRGGHPDAGTRTMRPGRLGRVL
jgi:hypothetical protein